MTDPRKKIRSGNYRDYVIRDGKFIGAFEEMYQNIEDPWNHGDATAIQYDLALLLLKRHDICRKGGRILDIGCGKGAFTSRIRDALPSCSITGVDVSPTAIQHAREKYRSRNIEFHSLDIQKDFRKIRPGYDLIVISQLVWYILPELEEILDYLIDHILAGNGYLLINQAFYKPEEQTYGKDKICSVEDLLGYIRIPSIEMLESNRLTNHDAVLLFQKKDTIG
jgi:SAM-dependent methyltransferase